MQDKKQNAVAKKDESSVEFMPFGASDKIRLTASMVRQFIAVPTKSGALPTERDCIRFIMLCRGKRANPFEGDCFLIGYDSSNGPSFSLVCGLELFEKRASMEESYDGTEGGVIIQTADNEIVERAGTLVLDGEKLVGGWAKVHRKDRTQCEYKSVKFGTYDTGRSRWQKDPGGMIMKVARSQALRAAYPTALGGLYTQEEMQRVTETGENLIAERPAITMPKELTSSAPEAVSQPEQPKTEDEPPEEEPPSGADDGEIKLEGVIKAVSRKPGKSAKGDYVKCGINIATEAGEQWANTFDTKLADIAEEMKGSRAVLFVKQGKYGFDLIDIEAAE